MSDVPFKGFACLNPVCQEWIFVKEDEIGSDFEIPCPTCRFVHRSGDEQLFYEFGLREEGVSEPIETGNFGILIDDYVAEAGRYKYCIVCNTLKPVEFFDAHASRRTKRQGECRLCKKGYNAIKNQTRTTDQHREAAQKRRLYLDLTGSGKIDSKIIYERFGYRCFKCSRDLREVAAEQDRPLDHTLPASYLWPLSTANATLLCRLHNAEKAGKWPGEYYDDRELKELSVRTGWRYDELAGKPRYNPEALQRLKEPMFVDRLLAKWSAYMPEMIKMRNRIMRDTGYDFFSVSTSISTDWIARADALLGSAQGTQRAT